MDDKIEVWKPVVGFENHYEVSSLGRVKSVIKATRPDGSLYNARERILKLQDSGNGYLKIHLRGSGPKKRHYVHRIVALAFIPNTENKPCIDHINTIRDDNRVENLRWCTMRENLRNPISRARYLKSRETWDIIKINKINQERNNSVASKKVYQYDINGCYLRSFDSVIEAARWLNVRTKLLATECNRRQHYYKGFLWYYTKHDTVPKYKPRRKRVLQFNMQGELIKEWETISSACDYYNNPGILEVCKGRRKTASGYLWKYKE